MATPGPLLLEGLARLGKAGIRTSLFIDPDLDAVRRSRELGAAAIELHTGSYARSPSSLTANQLRSAATEGSRLGLAVHAGHGLTTANVGAVASIPEIEELNIGHHIISRSIMVGIEAAVREMATAIRNARSAGR